MAVVRFAAPPPNGPERRPLQLPVEVRHKGVTTAARAVTLSPEGAGLLPSPPLPEGAGLLLSPPLPEGTLLRLTFNLPDELPEVVVVTWARVVASDADRGLLEVRFTDLRACDARRLARFLGARSGPSR